MKISGTTLVILLLIIGAVLFLCMGCKIKCSSYDKYDRVGGISRPGCYNIPIDGHCKKGYKASRRSYGGQKNCCLKKCYSHVMSAPKAKEFECPAGQIKMPKIYCGMEDCNVECCEPY